MALSVISNMAANTAHRTLTQSDAAATRSLAKLSAGKRVLGARDDAASMAIGARLEAEVQSLKTATTNASQASSMLQIADGALATTNSILVRMKSLAVQASSQNLSGTERGFISDEFISLRSEIDRIANDTEFNGQKLLQNNTVSYKIGTGGNTAEDDLQFTLQAADAAALSTSLGAITNFNTAALAVGAIGAVSEAIDELQKVRSSIGVGQNRLEFATQNLRSAQENNEASRSTLIDLDVAAEMTQFTSKQILVQSGVAMLSQANQMPQNLLRLLQ